MSILFELFSQTSMSILFVLFAQTSAVAQVDDQCQLARPEFHEERTGDEKFQLDFPGVLKRYSSASFLSPAHPKQFI